MLRKIIIVSLLLPIIGCSVVKVHHYKAFDNPNISKENLAVLYATNHIRVHKIDGKGKYYPSRVSKISPYSGARIELLEGPHTINVSYYQTTLYSKGKTDLKVNVKAGEAYFITDTFIQKNKKVQLQYEFLNCESKRGKEVRAKIITGRKKYSLPHIPICEIKKS